MKLLALTISITFTLLITSCGYQKTGAIETTDVLIIGGGASGVTAGIQAARMGADALIVEEHIWLGGMLTSAGVSAIDGNYKLYSGLWEEFRQHVYNYYGGADSVKTGWVSSVLFEPSVGDKILKKMVSTEKNLNVIYKYILISLEKKGDKWHAAFRDDNGDELYVTAKLIIDATELGDVVKMAGIPYRIGMDPKSLTGEDIALDSARNIVQDITYVATLKDYGPGANKTIDRPKGYNPGLFIKTCSGKVNESDRPLYTPQKMMGYGKLPNGKYMVNWPIYGNDYYLNIIECTREEREEALKAAKLHTLQYVYYLQTELGFKNLGLADNEYPTADKLPFIPYHRESRRVKGEVLFTLNHIAQPFNQEEKLYRTGVAVGDYPVDHHHSAYSLGHKFPDLHFYPVPSYTLPLGSLIPKDFDDFIVAEKSISVSNIVNGTTRLQPVCLLIGQAAGALAALSTNNNVQPRHVKVRDVQNALLNSSAYILPYFDVKPSDKYFIPVQKIGATGILKSVGKSEGWSNRTFFYPDSLVNTAELKEGLNDFFPSVDFEYPHQYLSAGECITTISQILASQSQQTSLNEIKETADKALIKHGLRTLGQAGKIKRAEFAVILNSLADPFNLKDVGLYGQFINR